MSNPISSEAQALLKMLDDYQWHPLTQIVQQLAKSVAPGKALRRYLTIENNREKHNGPRKNPPLSEDEQIASGRRAIASDCVTSLKKRYVEVGTAEDGRRQIRRRVTVVPLADRQARALDQPGAVPGTPVMQQPAAPAEAADPVDSLLPATIAFYDENQVRALLADELGRALDAFQHGMQGWLTQQFAGLEAKRPGEPPKDRPKEWPKQRPRDRPKDRHQHQDGRREHQRQPERRDHEPQPERREQDRPPERREHDQPGRETDRTDMFNDRMPKSLRRRHRGSR